jgi:hypothetical protein
VTSIAEPRPPARGASGLRALLLVGGLTLAALATPWPWGALWVVVPFAVGASLLLAWRFGLNALGLPALLAVACALLAILPAGGFRLWHLVWIPLASLTGVWMGVREEGGGPSLGERAWMHAPLLAAAFVLPLLPGLSGALVRLEARARVEERQMLSTLQGPDTPGSWRQMMEESAKMPAADRVRMLTFFAPNLVFLWMVVLVAAGRSLAARAAVTRGWPPLSRAEFTSWRLPDGALVPLLAGLALAVFANAAWRPGAAALLVQSVLGYSVQGVAVTQSVLLARGVPPVFVLLVMLLLFTFTLPVFLPSVALLGLSDVWLDFRRLEPSPRGEA